MKKKYKVFKKNENFIARKIGDEIILVPVYETSKDLDCIYNFNESAMRVWELINGKRTIEEIRKILQEEYEGTEEEIKEQLNSLIDELRDINAVT